jgi:hypothetical protein
LAERDEHTGIEAARVICTSVYHAVTKITMVTKVCS